MLKKGKVATLNFPYGTINSMVQKVLMMAIKFPKFQSTTFTSILNLIKWHKKLFVANLQKGVDSSLSALGFVNEILISDECKYYPHMRITLQKRTNNYYFSPRINNKHIKQHQLYSTLFLWKGCTWIFPSMRPNL